MQELFRKEVVNFLDDGLIYPISDNPWISPIHVLPKKVDDLKECKVF